MGNATILVIGVSDSDLSRISESLAAYRILAACDVTQAYGMLERQQTIQIVIIDLDMPDSRGMQLLAMVKSEPRFSSTHVIILTRSDDPDQEISGLRLCADDYCASRSEETLRAGSTCLRALQQKVWNTAQGPRTTVQCHFPASSRVF